ERELEGGMDEAPPDDRPLRRAVAEGEALDSAHVAGAIGLAEPRGAERGPCGFRGLLNAVWRGGMRGEEIVRLFGVLRRERGGAAHGAEEAGSRVGIVAGPAGDHDAFLVRGEFLLLAEGRKRHLGAVGAL